MIANNGSLYIFGGTNGQNTLNDFWKFSLSKKQWECLKTESCPEVKTILFSQEEDIRWFPSKAISSFLGEFRTSRKKKMTYIYTKKKRTTGTKSILPPIASMIVPQLLNSKGKRGRLEVQTKSNSIKCPLRRDQKREVTWWRRFWMKTSKKDSCKRKRNFWNSSVRSHLSFQTPDLTLRQLSQCWKP